METDLSEYHKGTDGLYYADYIAPNKAETFIGKLVRPNGGITEGSLP